MDINKLLLKIIESKYNELQNYRAKSGIFEKITHFEGNAIGQIGEKFVKEVFKNLDVKMQDFGDVVHDEFDICLQNGIKIEIKTARRGLKNNTFQFNGINPHYNCDFIVCIGLCLDFALFKIIRGEKSIIIKHANFI